MEELLHRLVDRHPLLALLLFVLISLLILQWLAPEPTAGPDVYGVFEPF